MFEFRTIPVSLGLCALVLAVWSGLVPDSTQAVSMGWALAVMVALYAVSAVVLRASRLEPSVSRAVDEAAQLNAARIAAPPANPSGEIR
jgi:hypothetical protein